VRLLEEKGILERRDFGGGRARYEPTEHGHHYHLIDIDTGKVIEFQDPEYERLMQTIAGRLGFDLVSLRLELFGRRQDPAVAGRDRAARARSARPAGSLQPAASAVTLSGPRRSESRQGAKPAVLHGKAER